VSKGHNSTFGLSFGGPIVKDKLFFFVNGEYEDNVTAGPAVQAGNGANYTMTSRRPQLKELESLSTYLKQAYGLVTGPWQDYNIKTPAYRLLARIDWNITDKHHLALRYNYTIECKKE
jgi:hypothetical protein